MTYAETLDLVLTIASIAAVPAAGWGLAIYQRATGVKVTDQQREIVLGAARTTAGIIQTRLDQKQLSIRNIHVDDPAIKSEAEKAIARVPDAAAALDTTPKEMAAIVVGMVNTEQPLLTAHAPP